MKLFVKEATIKKKFSIKHKFIHFTTKERAKKIIRNRKMLRTPEGITNFGPNKIYAVSVDYGIYHPSVQVRHLLKHSSLSDIVGIEFQTTEKPEVIYPEEAIWDNDEIPVINPKILTIAQAKKRIETKSNPLNDDYSEHIIFESEDLSEYHYDENYYLYKNNEKVFLSNSKSDLINHLKHNKPELINYFGFKAPEKKTPKGIIKLYRGIGYNQGDNYYSPSKEFALNFTRTGRESELKTKKIHTSKIHRHNPLPRGYGEEDENFEKAIDIARKNGKNAIWVDEGYNQPDSVFFF